MNLSNMGVVARESWYEIKNHAKNVELDEFVVMPDHLHLIAHQGREAVRLGQWIKAMKAVVGGLERRENKETNALAGDAGSGDPA